MAAEPQNDTEKALFARAARSRDAASVLAQQPRSVKDAALEAISAALLTHQDRIIASNAIDVEREAAAGMSAPLQDRLRLTPERIQQLVDAIAVVRGLDDPIGSVRRGQTLPNGLRLRQIRVPLGVIACIYEARPNVTVDIVALALKSGNAAILRGGSASREGNTVLIEVMREAVASVGLPADAIIGIDDLGRPGVQALLNATGYVDLLIPRGGKELIRMVTEGARVPVIATGDGNVHIVLDTSADPELAVDVVLNSKTQRTGTCNTAETLLIVEGSQAAPAVLAALVGAGVRVHADDAARMLAPESSLVSPATEADWDTEYLDLDIAVRVVDSLETAMDHIDKHSTRHTEAILTNSLPNAERFQREVDSASVIVNASTRFTDGGQFGLGAEVGISTARMHARGPMGVEELTTTKWLVNGEGQVRA
jgi:glutamate-5-semialdehyde dehydrogenase